MFSEKGKKRYMWRAFSEEKTEDFFVLCGVPYDGAEKKANLVDLCARLNIDCRFDEEENIYALGDTAEYAREVPVLMYHHLLPENELWQRKRDNITITVEEFKIGSGDTI